MRRQEFASTVLLDAKPCAVLAALAFANSLHAQPIDALYQNGFEAFVAKQPDSGQSWCADAISGLLTCPQSSFPDQDGEHGRDALARSGQLVKIGGGDAGFDYTKISNIGQALPANAALGSGPNEWACTRDNTTGLIWEVKTDNPTSLRHFNHTYSWHDTLAAINGGNAGSIGSGNTCNSTLALCNSSAFVVAVNNQGLCGAYDWRMPTPDELQGIVHYGFASNLLPTIDATYFVNTGRPGEAAPFWTGRSFALLATNAWIVDFAYGGITISGKSTNNGLRLVRTGL